MEKNPNNYGNKPNPKSNKKNKIRRMTMPVFIGNHKRFLVFSGLGFWWFSGMGFFLLFF
jgi:hypothetical protein